MDSAEKLHEISVLTVSKSPWKEAQLFILTTLQFRRAENSFISLVILCDTTQCIHKIWKQEGLKIFRFVVLKLHTDFFIWNSHEKLLLLSSSFCYGGKAQLKRLLFFSCVVSKSSVSVLIVKGWTHCFMFVKADRTLCLKLSRTRSELVLEWSETWTGCCRSDQRSRSVYWWSLTVFVVWGGF